MAQGEAGDCYGQQRILRSNAAIPSQVQEKALHAEAATVTVEFCCLTTVITTCGKMCLLGAHHF